MDGDTQSTIVTAARETELETPSGAWWGDYELRRSSRVAARPSAFDQTKSDADWERNTAARTESPHTASAPETVVMRSPDGGSSRRTSPGIAGREQGRRTKQDEQDMSGSSTALRDEIIVGGGWFKPGSSRPREDGPSRLAGGAYGIGRERSGSPYKGAVPEQEDGCITARPSTRVPSVRPPNVITVPGVMDRGRGRSRKNEPSRTVSSRSGRPTPKGGTGDSIAYVAESTPDGVLLPATAHASSRVMSEIHVGTAVRDEGGRPREDHPAPSMPEGDSYRRRSPGKAAQGRLTDLTDGDSVQARGDKTDSYATEGGVIIVAAAVERGPGRPLKKAKAMNTSAVNDSIVANSPIVTASPDALAGRILNSSTSQQLSSDTTPWPEVLARATLKRSGVGQESGHADGPVLEAIQVGTPAIAVKSRETGPVTRTPFGRTSRRSNMFAAKEGVTIFLGSLVDAKCLSAHQRVVSRDDDGVETYTFENAGECSAELHGEPWSETTRDGKTYLDVHGLFTHRPAREMSKDEKEPRPTKAFTIDEDHFKALMAAVPPHMAHDAQTPVQSWAVMKEAHRQAMRADNVDPEANELYVGREAAWMSNEEDDRTVMLADRLVSMIPHKPSEGVADRPHAQRTRWGSRGREWTEEEVEEVLDVTFYDPSGDATHGRNARPQVAGSSQGSANVARPIPRRDAKGRPLEWVESGKPGKGYAYNPTWDDPNHRTDRPDSSRPT